MTRLTAAGLISPMSDPNYYKATRLMKFMARLIDGDRMIYHLPLSSGATLATCMQLIDDRWLVYFNGSGLCTIKAEPHWAASFLARRWARNPTEPKTLFRDTIQLGRQCSDT